MTKRNKQFDTHIALMNGRIRARRCQALSKRSRKQCMKAALNGKRVCMFHGGKSTGPKTDAGRKRCAAAKTKHGWETKARRAARAAKLSELKEIERALRARGLLDV